MLNSSSQVDLTAVLDAVSDASSFPSLNASELTGPVDAVNRRGFLLLLDVPTTSVSFEGLGTAPIGRRFTLIVKQDGTGARAISWPVNIVWAGANVVQGAPNAVTIFDFHTTDGGVTFYGNRVYPTSVSVEMPEIVLDDFNRSDGPLGVSSSGEAWEVTPSGSFELAANKAKTVAATGNSHAWLDVGFSGAYKLTLDIVSADASGRTSVGILLRIVDVNNYILLLIANDAPNSGGRFSLFRRTSGSYTGLVGTDSAFGANVNMTVEVTYADGVIRVRRDGNTLFTYSLNTSDINTYSTSSKVGLRADAGGSTDNGTSQFDNFRIKPL